MITEDFKRFLHETINLEDDKIKLIDHYLFHTKARINSDTIEYPDGSTYFSEDYTFTIMGREYQRGRHDEQKVPVRHECIPVGMFCPNCQTWIGEKPSGETIEMKKD